MKKLSKPLGRQIDLKEEQRKLILSNRIISQRGELEREEVSETIFYRNSTDNKDSKNFVSLEIEVSLNPTMQELRHIYRLLGQPSIPTSLRNSPTSIALILTNLLVEKINQDEYLKAYNDSGNLEILVPPATMDAHRNLWFKYLYIEEFFNTHYLTAHESCGIHVNIDLNNFGQTTEERVETLKRFLWFLYENRNTAELQKFIGREGLSSVRSDVLAILGDPLGLLPHHEIKDLFFSEKEEILNCVINKEPSIWKPLNLTVYKSNRRALEWRWFGSTTKADKLFSITEFAFSLTEFCRSTTSTDWGEFMNYITKSNELSFLPALLYKED